MKKALLAVLERFGYVVVRVDAWQSLNQRLAQAEAAVPRAEIHRYQREAEQAGWEKMRAQRRVLAIRRSLARAKAEVIRCKDQLASADASGRIRALEEENRRLWNRVSDLDAYVEETGSPRRPFIL